MIRAINASLATLPNVRFVDIGDDLRRDDLCADGLHLADSGYRVWAESVARVLDEGR